MDVVGLYPSIPVAEGIDTVVDKVVDMITKLKDQIDMLAVSSSALHELLVHLKNTQEAISCINDSDNYHDNGCGRTISVNSKC